MPSLHNYLRTYRRKTGLSQDELAFLLGGETGTTVSRHETGKRLPTLDTALAYELILGASVKEIFVGEVETLARTISERASKLAARVERNQPTEQTPRKLEVLASLMLTDLEDSKFIPICDSEYGL